jgi:hypothetical protein
VHSRRLTLKKEMLGDLSTDELAQVVGGATDTCQSYQCPVSYTCPVSNTCPLTFSCICINYTGQC